MAPSSGCNYTVEMIQFTSITKSKLSLSLTFFLLTLSFAQLDNPTGLESWNCSVVNTTNSSALERNLKVVLKSLVENVNKTGFNISWHGQKGDTIYGLAQCRGDLNASACQACVSNATNPSKNFSESCRPSSSASVYLNGCFIRYETRNFYSDISLSDPRINNIIWCNKVKTNVTAANERDLDWTISGLLRRLIDDAVSSNVGYSTRNDSGIYSLAQCRGDLSMDHCNECLRATYKNLSVCQPETSEGDVLNANCIINYAKHKFYDDGVPLLGNARGSSPSTVPSRVTNQGKRHPLIVGLSIGAAVIVVALLGLLVIWKKNVIKLDFKKPRPDSLYERSSEHSTALSKSKLNYKFQTLQIATKNFDPANKIGQGGFGSVHKGVLVDGREIAVKRLLATREQSVSDFFNEVNLISRTQHKNLVNLLGFSVHGPDKFLVYEYLPNKSLDRFLYDEKMRKLLNWQRRFDIIQGTAGGLVYLHQESHIRIIHRDIKASNILLDQHFKPKIADFGLVRHFSEDQTHLSTGIVGTRGYMAPEYLIHGQLTEKVDVYAFGVLVLEIIRGRKNIIPVHTDDMPSLLTEIWNHHLLGTISNIIDPDIEENCRDEVLQVVHVALLCTQACARLRPSMSKVIMFLTTKDSNLPAPTQPPFIEVTHSESNTNVTQSLSSSNTRVAPPSETSSSVAALSLNNITTSSVCPR